MKSSRQRSKEIAARRQQRRLIGERTSRAPWDGPDTIPRGALPAEPSLLLHDNTYGSRPRYYVDTPFVCIECGTAEVWTAEQQKWWYEVAKGKIASRANRCSACRHRRRLRRSQERRVHIEGLIAKHGVEVAARRLYTTVEALEKMAARWRDA